MANPFIRTLPGAGGRRFVSLPAAGLPGFDTAPRTRRILAENVLRHHPGTQGLAGAAAILSGAGTEVNFTPERVLLQDHSGIPVLADLAAMASALRDHGLAPERAAPALQADLVVDHSIEAHTARRPDALGINVDREYALNAERYRFLQWAQQAFPGLRVIPPGHGIVHQVHLEHLAQCVTRDGDGLAVPDTVVGTDSHTPMINALGVLGWGVGGIEASVALLGEPLSILSPEVVGVRLSGRPAAGVLATDIALTLTRLLRGHGVVGAFVEFFGAGVRSLGVPDRATIANMAPEYGSTTAYFPIDAETLGYLRLTGRSPEQIALVEAYAKEQGLFASVPADSELSFPRVLDFDLSAVSVSVAGPSRPQDRLDVTMLPGSLRAALQRHAPPRDDGGPPHDGAIAIAAITSCTNTSNPAAMLAAGLLARRAVRHGLTVPAWVKTSLAPGSRTVTAYLEAAGLLDGLSTLGFDLVGYGCTTCIGNSGDLLPEADHAVRQGRRLFAVLSGNRNFEGRIHPSIAGAYLMSPPLVVAFALAGTTAIDLTREPLGTGADGRPVYLADLWPSPADVDAARLHLRTEAFELERVELFEGDQRWREIDSPRGPVYDWPEESTYLVRTPLVDPLPGSVPEEIIGARALVIAPDSTTTDHISPAGSIPRTSPAGAYLAGLGIPRHEFNSYGCRRGNHEVLVRGTYAGSGLRNRLVPDRAGGWTMHLPSRRVLTVYQAAGQYQASGVPTVVFGGSDYGMGSSRDWAAKGPSLLGVRAVLAKSFERIHRSNLAAAGVIPLQFPPGAGFDELGLTGHESYDLTGVSRLRPGGVVRVRATDDSGSLVASWEMTARIDTDRELTYVRRGGFLRAAASRLIAEQAMPAPGHRGGKDAH